MNWMDPQAVQKFQAVESLIRREAEDPQRGALAVCRKCGLLPLGPDITSWQSLADFAIAHAMQKGHAVAATRWTGRVFTSGTAVEEDANVEH